MTTPPDVSSMPRRLFLRRMLGTAGGLVVTAVAAACGANKSAAEGAASAAAPAPTVAPVTTAAAAGTSVKGPAATTAAPASAATNAQAATTTPVAAGAAFNAANEMAIAFTYVADAATSGRFHNPYVAVWIEDAAGAAVRASASTTKSVVAASGYLTSPAGFVPPNPAPPSKPSRAPPKFRVPTSSRGMA